MGDSGNLRLSKKGQLRRWMGRVKRDFPSPGDDLVVTGWRKAQIKW